MISQSSFITYYVKKQRDTQFLHILRKTLLGLDVFLLLKTHEEGDDNTLGYKVVDLRFDYDS